MWQERKAEGGEDVAGVGDEGERPGNAAGEGRLPGYAQIQTYRPETWR